MTAHLARKQAVVLQAYVELLTAKPLHARGDSPKRAAPIERGFGMTAARRSGRLSLIKLRHGYGADIHIDPDCERLDGYYLLVLPTRGQAVFHFDGQRIEVSPSQAFLLSPDRRFHFSVSHDYEQVLCAWTEAPSSTPGAG